MHKKHAKDGLAAVSLSLDDPKDKHDVLKFLQQQGATFTNLILDESQEFWQEKFKFDGPPSVFVFSREGKWTQFTGAGNSEQIDKLVEELLRQK